MKLWIIINLLLGSVTIGEMLEAKQKVAGSYCVMSMHDLSILDSDNMEHTQSVASISKMMTAIIAIEEGNLKEKITVSDVVNQTEGSMLYLRVGEKYTLEDLLYGLMLRSGNDAALLIATHIAKEEEAFADLMNQKAKELHMESTFFRNASGLDEKDGGNVSSSCDMALLTSYAMKNETFQKIVSTKSYSPRNGIVWINKNKFLKNYEWATGGKTGFTKQAKRTLVTTSRKDHMEVVVVTLQAADDFALHEALHEAAYEYFEEVTVIKKGEYDLQGKRLRVLEDITRTIQKGESEQVTYLAKKKKDGIHIVSEYRKQKQESVLPYE